MNDNDTATVDNGLGIENALSINDFSESSLSRTYLTGGHVHYESQAFNVQLAVNPLVSAAAPLLHIAIQIREQGQAPDTDNLFQALCHEIRTLEYRAHACGYPPATILSARYLTCALLDEIVLSSSWGKKSCWHEQNLLNTFQREPWGGEHFFLILERCAQNPENFIDLLELGYLCLSLGYKGKYHQAESSQHLETIIDNLYKLIRRQRGDFPRYLALDSETPKAHKKSFWRLPPLWVTIILTATILTGIFIPYHHRLQQLSQPIHQLLNSDQYSNTHVRQSYE